MLNTNYRPTPRPPNEKDRLSVVQSLLPATLRDLPELTALSTLTRDIFGTESAGVTIIEEDWQRIAASVGLGEVHCSRDQSVCTHVVYRNAPIVIEDMSQHADFAHLPFVAGEPHFRFYAGAPIQIEDDVSVGALCVMDRRPRHFSHADFDRLQKFATVATGLIKMHRANVMLRQEEQHMRHAAMTDPLTGLYNRRALPTLVDASLRSILRRGGSGGVICLDLDRFKAVNDTMGHDAGDAMLTEAARRIRLVLRPADHAVRMGGDEFAIFFGTPMTREVLRDIAQRLLDLFRQPFRIGDTELCSRASLGIALAPRDGASLQELSAHVDLALYAAKAAGRDRYVFFDALPVSPRH